EKFHRGVRRNRWERVSCESPPRQCLLGAQRMVVARSETRKQGLCQLGGSSRRTISDVFLGGKHGISVRAHESAPVQHCHLLSSRGLFSSRLAGNMPFPRRAYYHGGAR